MRHTHHAMNPPRPLAQQGRLWALLFIGFSVLLLAALARPNVASAAPPQAPAGQTVPGGTVPLPSPLVLLSAGHRGEAETAVDEVDYRDEDIVAYLPATGELGIYFDGSDHGLGPVDLEDFELLDDGSLYFTINKAFALPNPHGVPTELHVDDSDVVKYDPSSDSFSIFLVGADVGLTKGSEDIDALAFAPDGRLLISTIGSAKVKGSDDEVKAKDEDLIACDGVSKTCELYFDGSDIALTKSGEDLMATWVEPSGAQNLYLTTKGKFKVEGSASNLKGHRDVIVQCTPLALGDTTDCTLAQFLDAEEIDWENQIDGLAINFNTTLAPLKESSALEAASVNQDEEALSGEDYIEATNEGDDEIDTSDFIDVARELYLPIVAN